ncbi:MAG: glycosyltransferase family 9 protein [Bryobacteraceae bacterium]
MPVLDSIPPGSRVLIVRLRSLGDCVLTTPAIRLLRQHRADLEIGVVVEDRFRGVFEGNPDLAALHPPSPTAAALWRPALTINLHGGTRSAVITAASAARWRAGFGHFRNATLYNVRIPRAQEILGEDRVVHTAEHVASAMFFLGVPRAGIPRAQLHAAGPRAGAPYAVIHPFASEAAKAWPADRFAAVASQFGDAGIEPVFIGARSDDLSPFGRFRREQGAPLAEVKNLLAGASLFVGNDSGPAHMAAAFGVPLVVLFGNSDARIWRPWRAPSEVIDAGRGLAEVPVARVFAAAEKLLVQAGKAAP